jgi:hypothetical protein
VLGDPAYHLDDLRLNAKYNQPTVWTINSRARAGDAVMFYFIRPASAIVATGKLLKDAFRESRPDSDWYNYYLAEIGEIQMLDAPVGIKILRERCPAWGWLKSPIKSTVVPSAGVKSLKALLDNND